MSHVINHLEYNSDFLRNTGPGRLDCSFWHKELCESLVKQEKLDICTFEKKQSNRDLFMEQTRNTISHLHPEVRQACMAVLGWNTVGSLEIEGLWSSPKLWHFCGQLFNVIPYNLVKAFSTTLLNIHPSRFFHTVCEISVPSFTKNRLSSERSLISEFSSGNAIFNLTGRDNLYDFNDEIRCVASRFSSLEQNVIVLENRICGNCADYLCTGRVYAPNVPFGRENIYNNNTLPCILPLNAEIGFSMRLMLAEVGGRIPLPGIPLAYYDDPKNMSFNDLQGKELILVCSPDISEWEDLPSIIKLCERQGVRQVHIYPFPIDGEYIFKGKREINEIAHDRLKEKAKDLTQCESITRFYEHLIAESIPAENLQSFIREYEIDKESHEHISMVQPAIQFRPWHELDTSSPVSLDELSIRNFISPASTTLIYGASNVGKSWFVCDLCIALATGIKWLDFTPSQPAKVFYLDGEVGSDFGRRIPQLIKDIPENQRLLLQENFLIHTCSSSDELLGHKEQFLDILGKEKPDVLVIDNILALAPKSWRGKSDELFNFLTKIKSLGIAPILVHHTDKKGTSYLGSVSLHALCQNIIYLEDARNLAA